MNDYVNSQEIIVYKTSHKMNINIIVTNKIKVKNNQNQKIK